MGEVRLARSQSGRLVAIKHVRKTLNLDPQLCLRLTEEAHILSRIAHPNVVQVLDGGVGADGQPFLVMARAYGTPLDIAITRTGAFSRERIAGILGQVFEGLAAIHDAGIIHADLKSSNILLDELDRATIIDFGLARVASKIAIDDVFAGTPAYMAPELLSGGPPSIQGDIFAAGVIAYELLTGSPPLPRDMQPMMLLAKRLHESAEPPSRRAPARAITPELDKVLARALSRDVGVRFSSILDMADAMCEALAAWEPRAHDAGVRSRGLEHLAPTVELVAPVETQAPTNEQLTKLRVNRDDRVITEALSKTSAAVANRDVAGAVALLEDALRKLVPSSPLETIAPEAWRIETVLAALYQSQGRKDHAMRLARVACQHAQRTGSTVAKARAQVVMEQVTAEQTRMARGSRPPIRRKKSL
jgi:serine/threonine protein kinase